MADMTLDQVLDEMRAWRSHTGFESLRLLGWANAIEVAIKQREQDAKDTARYRWLREGDNDEKVMSRSGEDWDDVFVLRREKLDAAIDAAMAKESGNG